MTEEIWKAILPYKLFEVSNLGRVRKVESGEVKKQWTDSMGYSRVYIGKDAYVHHLVCEAFKGTKPNREHCALHKDDIRGNNTEYNLYWGTEASNAQDRKRNQRTTAKLTIEQVAEMKRLNDQGVKQWELAIMFDINQPSVSRILRQKSYSGRNS